MTQSESYRIRSIMPRGNGAYIVHSELADVVPEYELLGCSPYLASIPGLPHPALRNWLSEATVVHLSPSYGNIPLPGSCSRVVTFHSFDIDSNNMEQASFAQRLYYRYVLRPAAIASAAASVRIVAVSRYVADCIYQHRLGDLNSIEVIHNGIDTQRFRPADENKQDRPLRVLFVGNPTRRKGFHLLAEFAEQLPNGVELAFTSGLRNEQTNLTHRRLVSLGHVPYSEMHQLYQQADILLFPAYREGFGLCVAEAMASGLPVVSSNCSAIPELIDEGRGGYLVDPGDIPAMLERTRRLLENTDLRESMGQWNRDRALKDFDRKRMGAEYQALFRSLP